MNKAGRKLSAILIILTLLAGATNSTPVAGFPSTPFVYNTEFYVDNFAHDPLIWGTKCRMNTSISYNYSGGLCADGINEKYIRHNFQSTISCNGDMALPDPHLATKHYHFFMKDSDNLLGEEQIAYSSGGYLDGIGGLGSNLLMICANNSYCSVYDEGALFELCVNEIWYESADAEDKKLLFLPVVSLGALGAVNSSMGYYNRSLVLSPQEVEDGLGKNKSLFHASANHTGVYPFDPMDVDYVNNLKYLVSGESDFFDTTSTSTTSTTTTAGYYTTITYAPVTTFPPHTHTTTSTTLGTTTTTTIAPSIYGTCSTAKGYSRSITVDGGTDYVGINLGALDDYLFSSNLENVWTDYTDSYYKSANHLIVNTTTTKTFTLYIAGFDHNISKDTTTQASDVNITLTSPSNFTLPYTAYLVDFEYEDNGTALDFADTKTCMFKVLCPYYAPSTYNMKTWDRNPMFITMVEKPMFEIIATLNGSKNGASQSSGSWSYFNPVTNITTTYFNYTNPPVSTDFTQFRRISTDTRSGNHTMFIGGDFSKSVWQFYTLEDYIGDYRLRGKLRISANVNNSIVPVHIEPWLNLENNVITTTMVNGTDYLVEVYIYNRTTQNFGWHQAANAAQRKITIISPLLDTKPNHYKGVSYTWEVDPEHGHMGLSYAVVDPAVTSMSINFTVRNDTGIEYSAVLTTLSGGFYYDALNPASGYTMSLEADIPGHSIIQSSRVVIWAGQTTQKLLDAFDLENVFGSGGTFLGISIPSIETGTSYILIMFVGLLAGAANWSVILAIIALLTGFLYTVGWLESYAPIIVLTFLMAAMGKIVLDRDKQGAS